MASLDHGGDPYSRAVFRLTNIACLSISGRSTDRQLTRIDFDEINE